MNKLCLAVLALSVCAAGCTTSYRIHVNGFSELDQPIKENSSIFVAIDPNSRNPIFDNEIRAKIEMLLKEHNYIPAAAIGQADYRLTFQVGLDSRKVSGYTPLYHPYIGFHDRYWGDYHFGYYGYIPYIDTYYDQWLVMKVFPCKTETSPQNKQIVWIGEAIIGTDAADLRRIVNYLLVGLFEYFGKDTSRQMVVRVSYEDPRIVRLTNLK